jgi:hypothetical protein
MMELWKELLGWVGVNVSVPLSAGTLSLHGRNGWLSSIQNNSNLFGDPACSNSPTLNHFYEKLLLLKDIMNTATGKKIALERHKYMENFLSQFYAEWEGEK